MPEGHRRGVRAAAVHVAVGVACAAVLSSCSVLPWHDVDVPDMPTTIPSMPVPSLDASEDAMAREIARLSEQVTELKLEVQGLKVSSATQETLNAAVTRERDDATSRLAAYATSKDDWQSIWIVLGPGFLAAGYGGWILGRRSAARGTRFPVAKGGSQ